MIGARPARLQSLLRAPASAATMLPLVAAIAGAAPIQQLASFPR
jgi:hypothetical protein